MRVGGGLRLSDRSCPRGHDRSVTHKGTRDGCSGKIHPRSERPSSPLTGGFETASLRSASSTTETRERGGRRPRRRTSPGRRRRRAGPRPGPGGRTGRRACAVTGTGRALGSQAWSAAVPVKASRALRPSRPVISTAAMSLVLSWASPCSSCSTSPRSATTGTSSRRLRQPGRARRGRPRGRPARRRTTRARRPARGRPDRCRPRSRGPGWCASRDGARGVVGPAHLGWSACPSR